MKRALILLLAILLNPLVYGEVHVRIPNVNGLPGTPVIIPIMVEDATNISTMFFSLEFDSTVLSVAGKDDLVKGDLLADHSAGAGVKTGKLNVTIFSSSRASFRAASGSAAQVVADIDFGAAFGSSHNLTLSNVTAYDSSGVELTTQVTAGTLNITNQANTPGADQNLEVFPQFANGVFLGGSFKTQLMFVNSTNATSDVEISFAKSRGVPWNIKMDDDQPPTSKLTLAIPPSGTKFLNSAGTGDLGVGYASLVATAPVEGRIVFEMLDGAGKSITAAGVSAAPLVNFFEIPVVYKKNVYDTGIALYNANDSPVVVQLRVKEVDGDVLATKTLTLQSFEHLPQFSGELFAAISAQAEFQGSIEVTASLPIAAVALKQAGLVLTTFEITIPQQR